MVNSIFVHNSTSDIIPLYYGIKVFLTTLGRNITPMKSSSAHKTNISVCFTQDDVVVAFKMIIRHNVEFGGKRTLVAKKLRPRVENRIEKNFIATKHNNCSLLGAKAAVPVQTIDELDEIDEIGSIEGNPSVRRR
ncbi:jg3547 [Pararge aegeria aegeria]|uniref:Jg3547 protein n=1 Tax=Pararge aegeria aegeria TaxID=348720 RepID=A0A8S4RL39_9NEOP|nr:jg3547 [Pararge aegeria aegeria]